MNYFSTKIIKYVISRVSLFTLRRLIIVQGGLIRSTGVVLVVLVLVFLVPGVGLVIVDVVASHYVY